MEVFEQQPDEIAVAGLLINETPEELAHTSHPETLSLWQVQIRRSEPAVLWTV
jgi:hypothetical protein